MPLTTGAYGYGHLQLQLPTTTGAYNYGSLQLRVPTTLGVRGLGWNLPMKLKAPRICDTIKSGLKIFVPWPGGMMRKVAVCPGI